MWPWPKVRLLFCTRGQQASLSRSVICLTRFRVYQKRKLVLSIHARFGLLLEQRWPNPEAPTLETGMAFSMCPVPNLSAFWAWPWQAGDFGTHGGSVRCTVLSWEPLPSAPKAGYRKGLEPSLQRAFQFRMSVVYPPNWRCQQGRGGSGRTQVRIRCRVPAASLRLCVAPRPASHAPTQARVSRRPPAAACPP